MTICKTELKTSAENELFKITKGYYTTKVLLSLWRIGLLDRAASGQDLDVNTIAAEEGCNPSMLRPLFNYLIVRGYFEAVSSDVFRLTSLGVDSIPYYGYLSTMVGAYEPVFSRIEDLATGKVKYGKDVSRSHEEMTRGLTALEDGLMGRVTEVVGAASVNKVIDLGCGSARMLAQICKLDEHIQAVGIDLSPDSCAVARETVQREGLDSRLTIVEGNAGNLRSLPTEILEGVDVVTVMFLLHEILGQQGRTGVVKLLTEIASIIGKKGRLVIVEVSGTSEYKYMEDLLFVPEYQLLHEYTNQKLAPRSAWESMVNEAGMSVIDFAPVNMCQSFCLVASPTADRNKD